MQIIGNDGKYERHNRARAKLLPFELCGKGSDSIQALFAVSSHDAANYDMIVVNKALTVSSENIYW